MNLGGIEAVAQQIAGQAILDHAKDTEAQLDAKLAELDKLGEDDFETLRERRKLQLMKQAAREKEWRANGHGRYSEIPDQGDFFAAAKKSPAMAVHFYRPTTARCAIVDARLERLAPRHVETRFARIDAEKSPYLVEKLGIVVMPTILLVKDGQVVHQVRGFDEMGGSDDFHEDALAWVLAQHGVCKFEGEPPSNPNKGVNSISMAVMGKRSIREGGVADSDDDDFSD